MAKILVADERFGHRRVDRDAARPDIRFVGPHDHVFHPAVGIRLSQEHGAPEDHLVRSQVPGVDDLGPGQLIVQLFDPAFHVIPPLLGHPVIGVVADVSMGCGFVHGL